MRINAVHLAVPRAFAVSDFSWIGCPERETSRSGGVLALRAAGAGLPKRWPAASAVRQRQRETLFERVSALDVGSEGFRARQSCKEKRVRRGTTWELERGA